MSESTELTPKQRAEILALSIARFRPEDEIHSLEQECFFAYPRAQVATRFLRDFLTLLPPNLQRNIPVSEGPLAVGSRLIATPQFLTRPQVAVEIVAFDEEHFAYAYLEGSPFRGTNTIRFRDERGGSVAGVTLRYQVVGVATAIGWYLLGGARFHRKLIAEGFKTLARVLASEPTGDAGVEEVQRVRRI